MRVIKEECSQLKASESGIVRDIFITVGAWKTGIRKVQTKVSNFYDIKMKHFHTVNKYSQLNL